jgi:hypothetical protein
VFFKKLKENLSFWQIDTSATLVLRVCKWQMDKNDVDVKQQNVRQKEGRTQKDI